MNKEFPLIAKTLQGLEDILAKELAQIGANNIQKEKRGVSFTGNNELMYKANLHCRTAIRILKPIFTFQAKNADEIYAQIKKIHWEKYFSAKESFAISAVVYSETFSHSKFVTYKVKDAIVD